MSLKTGFDNLDNIMGDINSTALIAIASCLGMGKSTLAYNIANATSKQSKGKVLYFMLDANKEILKERITNNNVEIVVDDTITVERIKSKCERVAKSGLSLVVVDYLQLVSTSSITDCRSKQIDYISRTLKTITLELNVPIIVLSQLGRQGEERENKRPVLRDLDVMGSLVQDSDRVIFLYRENYYNKDYELNDTEIIVAKNRYGATGKVDLLFDSDTQTYK